MKWSTPDVKKNMNKKKKRNLMIKVFKVLSGLHKIYSICVY